MCVCVHDVCACVRVCVTPTKFSLSAIPVPDSSFLFISSSFSALSHLE